MRMKCEVEQYESDFWKMVSAEWIKVSNTGVITPPQHNPDRKKLRMLQDNTI